MAQSRLPHPQHLCYSLETRKWPTIFDSTTTFKPFKATAAANLFTVCFCKVWFLKKKEKEEDRKPVQRVSQLCCIVVNKKSRRCALCNAHESARLGLVWLNRSTWHCRVKNCQACAFLFLILSKIYCNLLLLLITSYGHKPPNWSYKNLWRTDEKQY